MVKPVDLPDIPEVPDAEFGSPAHARGLTNGRFTGVGDALHWLTFTHLTPALQRYSAPFYTLAAQVITSNPTDCPEMTTALNKILEAKDLAVRAGIRNDDGGPGPIPGPPA